MSWCRWSSAASAWHPAGATTRSRAYRWAASAPRSWPRQLPGYFGSASAFSGPAPAPASSGRARAPGVRRALRRRLRPPGRVLRDGPQLHPPGREPARTRLYVTVGNGAPEPGVTSSPAAITAGGVAEAELREAGGRVRGRRPRRGRRHHLRPAARRARLALLAPAPARGDRVGAVQARARGAALVVLSAPSLRRARCGGCATAFRAPPSGLVEFERAGARLRGRGSGHGDGGVLGRLLGDRRAALRPRAATADLRAHRREGQPAPGAAGAHARGCGSG